MARRSRLDIVAALSMSAALLFGETLAAAVVALMYSGGTFLESFAEGRARREMHALLERVPRTATRYRQGRLEDITLDDISPALLAHRQGEVVPVDGKIESASAFLDTSALTGGSLPRRVEHGDDAMSGSTNAGEAFDLLATRLAKDSTYAGIVRLVEEAQRSKAPMARLSASRQRRPFLMTKIMPEITRRSSTRGIPCDSGKYGSIRRICLSVNQEQVTHGRLLLPPVNQIEPAP